MTKTFYKPFETADGWFFHVPQAHGPFRRRGWGDPQAGPFPTQAAAQQSADRAVAIVAVPRRTLRNPEVAQG